MPDPPDCRDAVVARIASPAAHRPAWAYAVALVALGFVVLTVFALLPRHEPAHRQLEGTPGIRRMPTPANRPAVATESGATPTSAAAPSAGNHATRPIRRRGGPTGRPPLLAANSKPGYSAVRRGQRPLALVIVSWSADDDPSQRSYSYTFRDLSTGETTTCAAERSGDSVKLYLERKCGATPPVGG